MDKPLGEDVSGQIWTPKIKASIPNETKDELRDLKAKVTQDKMVALEKGEESSSEEDDWKDTGTDSSDQENYLEYYSDWESSDAESVWEDSDSERDYSDKEAQIGHKHVVHKTKKYKHVGQETKEDKWKLVVNCYRSRGKMWKLRRRARLKGQVKGGQNTLKVAMEVWQIKERELNTSKEAKKKGY